MEGMSAVVPIEHETLGRRVYLDLRNMLVSGYFEPGERLTLRKLAAALGTSAMPVRDALNQLMVEQAIELLPSRSFRVPIMSRTRFTEIRDIRIRLEGMAVEAAARKITEDELKKIEKISAAFNAECELQDPDPSKLIVHNKDFHFSIYCAAQMPVLLPIIEGLWSQIGPVLNLDVRRGSSRINNKVPSEHHQALIEALRKGDSDMARAALEADLNGAAEHILNQNKLPD